MVRPISAVWRPGNTAPKKGRRGDEPLGTVSDLTVPGIEQKIYRSDSAFNRCADQSVVCSEFVALIFIRTLLLVYVWVVFV